MDKKREECNLTNAQIRKITEAASKAAIEAYQEAARTEKQKNKDKRLYNTRLLMEKYRGLVKYAEDAVVNAAQVDEDMALQTLMEIMGAHGSDPVLTVEVIQARVARTKIILAHVDKMLDYYRVHCMTSGKAEIERKWGVIEHLYLDENEETVQDLALLYHVDERTIYRCISAALQDLCALFFGAID